MNDTKPDAVMTVQEVSEYLKLAKSTIYRLAQEGQLPGRKVGGTWRFSRNSLDKWLAVSLTDDTKLLPTEEKDDV